ncbi:hypothetical protein DY000_02048619 [Brassica cretica]|uniref:Uncharacterized protein n=1 Tax=Brassica cretica TaxID=69181 RepID=A0ABQ7F586_BRACR|nr:hypothetical protein DY000_02048619 [Brassica cretica]
MNIDRWRQANIDRHQLLSIDRQRNLRHAPKPLRIKKSDIDWRHEPSTDRQTDSTDNRRAYSSVDRQPPLTYRVQLLKIDVSRLNTLRNPSQPS